VRSFRADPLVFQGNLRARTGNELLKVRRGAAGLLPGGGGPAESLCCRPLHFDACRTHPTPQRTQPQAIKHLERHRGELLLPVYTVHGTKDAVTSMSVSEGVVR
jgi:hypothetical protein